MKSGRKLPGAKPTAPAQNPATQNLIAVDRVQLADSFRRIARQSAEAARLNRQIADKIESLPATPAPATPKGSEARR